MNWWLKVPKGTFWWEVSGAPRFPEERRDGEFRSLRVCRCLGQPWSFDVELLRWGEAEVPLEREK